MKLPSILFFYLLIITPVFSITGYVRFADASFCMDDCSLYYLEDEYGEFLTWITHLDNIDMLVPYTDRFVEIEGEEVWCVECGAIDVTSIEISDECEFPVDCFADPCTVEFCPEFPEAECIPNYCEGCWADYYLDGEFLDCSVQTDCIDLTGIDFGACDMVLGIGWINENCEYISGCDWVVDGIDYSSAFFDSMEECYEACENSAPTETVTYSVQQGWNLIGLPVEVENSSYQVLFPNTVEGTLYSFNGGYITEEYFIPGTGYWLRFQLDESVIVSGTHINNLTINLFQEWNLISGLNQITNIENIYDPFNLIVPGTFYGFNNGYEEVFQLSPGESYWVRSTQLGVIHINFE
ncbi:MAG: hypothetical protein QGH24_04495 [Candidatus Marinimicrobia bacterium]|jgi:hypothetical protein|nr:hypothetical protein [Candidatus Neomarinimicrobiota bacterium]